MKNKITIFVVLIVALFALIFNYVKASGGLEYLNFLSGGTLTDTKFCIWDNATSKVVCNSTAFANPMTAAGDIIYGGAAGAATRLASSSDYSILNLDANGYPAWTQTLGTEANPLTAGYFTTLNASTSKITTLTIDLISPGQLLVATSTPPDYSYQYDTNTGLGWISDDKQALYAGGTARLTVDSTGNVGIGTTSPGSLFEVYSSPNTVFSVNTLGHLTAGSLTLSQIGGENAIPLRIINLATGQNVIYARAATGQTANVLNIVDDNDNPYLVVNNSGNVGIGTTTPAITLDVNGYVKALQVSTTTACSDNLMGSIFYNQANNEFWGCGSGSTWKKLSN